MAHHRLAKRKSTSRRRGRGGKTARGTVEECLALCPDKYTDEKCEDLCEGQSITAPGGQAGAGRYTPSSVYASKQPLVTPSRVYGYTRGLTRTETFPARVPGREYGNIEDRATGRGYFHGVGYPDGTRNKSKRKRMVRYF